MINFNNNECAWLQDTRTEEQTGLSICKFDDDIYLSIYKDGQYAAGTFINHNEFINLAELLIKSYQNYLVGSRKKD